MEVSGQRHAPAAVHPQEKDPRYALDRILGAAHTRSGRRGQKKKITSPCRKSSPGRLIPTHPVLIPIFKAAVATGRMLNDAPPPAPSYTVRSSQASALSKPLPYLSQRFRDRHRFTHHIDDGGSKLLRNVV
jgi:hypothetical protein